MIHDNKSCLHKRNDDASSGVIEALNTPSCFVFANNRKKKRFQWHVSFFVWSSFWKSRWSLLSGFVCMLHEMKLFHAIVNRTYYRTLDALGSIWHATAKVFMLWGKFADISIGAAHFMLHLSWFKVKFSNISGRISSYCEPSQP